MQAKDAGEKKADAGEKKADAGEKKAEGPAPAVFKIDLHCDGCAKKVRRYVRNFDGKKSNFFLKFHYFLQNFPRQFRFFQINFDFAAKLSGSLNVEQCRLELNRICVG